MMSDEAWSYSALSWATAESWLVGGSAGGGDGWCWLLIGYTVPIPGAVSERDQVQ